MTGILHPHRSILDVRLADGSEPPTGAPARVLIALDAVMHSEPETMGREHLLRALSEYLDVVPSQSELDAVLTPLIQRGWVTDCGSYEPEYLPLPDFAAGIALPKLRKPRMNPPKDGEQCYKLTSEGRRVARVCVGLVYPAPRPWFLGDERVNDQIVLATNDHSTTLNGAALDLPHLREDRIVVAVEAAIDAGLLERAADDATKWSLTVAGALHKKRLEGEIGAVFVRMLACGAPDDKQIPVALRLDPARKLELLKSFTEEELCVRVVMPLLEALGFLDVTYNNGPQERGKDIYCWKPDELGEQQWLSVLAKAGDLRGAASGNSSTLTVVNQIRQGLLDPVVVPPAATRVVVDRCWVIFSGDFVGDALSKVEHELRGQVLLRATKWVPGKRLVRLLDRHCPSIWAKLLGT